MDHAGSVKELKDLTNAKVAVHAEDADYVSGKKPLEEHSVVSQFSAARNFCEPRK
jgi:glyoxylase-like metal-dependent hydrolase (beta-lactamase superfamily II)